MILKFSQKCFWDSWVLVYCWFDSYFTFISKAKLQFSLICNFHYCLLKGDWALKVAYQFAIRGLVAYKPATYKKVFTFHCKRLWSKFWSIYPITFPSWNQLSHSTTLNEVFKISILQMGCIAKQVFHAFLLQNIHLQRDNITHLKWSIPR